jgi:hypothetical protein
VNSGEQPLAEKFYPTRHTTIGAVIDAGLKIHGFCIDCGHSEDVDLMAAATTLGREHSSLPVHLVPKLVCSRCGSKNVGMVLAPDHAEPPAEQLDHLKEEWARKPGG